MRTSYNVWILKRYECKKETDIIAVFFNRDLAEQARKEHKEDTGENLVIWAANAVDSGY